MTYWTVEPWTTRWIRMKHWYLDLCVLRVWLTPGLLTFRLFGKGLNIKNVKLHPLLHSQQTSWLPILTIGSWQVRWLP